MAEYIDRKALLNNGIHCRDGLSKGMLLYVPLVDVKRSIKNFPEADVVKVRNGRWIKRGYACGENEYECSACHETEWRTTASRMKYCMFCGAKMDKEAMSDDTE